ncbi:SDR family oxidoreductase [Inquilinus limosus]|uniref:SDR family oxidoreductase n=1 Tax=Inquilinus limosus TaxID=171674 RepID=UPI000411C04B|nr:SDR family NAD(P)-dependent oxidoreductase [Inquilinus limosus]
MAGVLSGRTILVAGAGGGMGRATALAAAREGGSLLLLGRDRARLESVAAEIREIAPDRPAAVIAADAADAAALDTALAPHAGVIDIAVNSVGTNIVRRAFGELTPDSWSVMVDVNLNAAFNLTRAVLPGMRRRKQGLIIHISSVAARRPDRSGAAYQAAKAGVLALSHAVMEEERENGLRLTVILPGMTDTPLLDKRPVPVPPEARRAALQPEDVAAACLFVMALPPRAHVAEIVLQPSRS